MLARCAVTAPAMNAPATPAARASSRSIPSFPSQVCALTGPSPVRNDPVRWGDPVSGDLCPERNGKTHSDHGPGGQSSTSSRRSRMTAATLRVLWTRTDERVEDEASAAG
ncbi:hypothetical protein GCM10010411_38150 [Actinomadura fulvescens]|uniref:Secreted protein n=1 Tax=Actinomadura fulvescens TaxID=46160 RepID=A0ABN3PUA9_9ACTN